MLRGEPIWQTSSTGPSVYGLTPKFAPLEQFQGSGLLSAGLTLGTSTGIAAGPALARDTVLMLPPPVRIRMTPLAPSTITIPSIVSALIIAVVLRTFVVQPFSIPSGSMEKSLLVNDFLFVSKFYPRLRWILIPRWAMFGLVSVVSSWLRGQRRRAARTPPHRAT